MKITDSNKRLDQIIRRVDKRKRKRATYMREYRKTHENKGGKRKKKQLPFRVWDCEGKTFPDGSHAITLLANSDGECIENSTGLSTIECLRFLVEKRTSAINVWFSCTYDVTQILREIPLGEIGDGEFDKTTLAALHERNQIKWNDYSIRFIPRKFFHVRLGKLLFRSFDTFGFFQTSFLKTCAEWGIDTSEIEEGKKNRSQFATWSDKRIREYNFKEMELLRMLVEKLRSALQQANLEPNSWHGPGAIALVWLRREHIKEHMPKNIPDTMQNAIGRAFFGGRIDVSNIGERYVERHDIVSAYPSALCECISLADIQWQHSSMPHANDEHALYHVEWNTKTKGNRYANLWHPFPWRTNAGAILYPDCTKRGKSLEGWYWGIEILAAERLFPGCIKRIEAWYPIGEKIYPFREAIQRDFQQRKEYKKQKHPAEKALKLALNSLYGKLCQHQTAHNKPMPTYQCFIWGGFITAYTRAKILDAIGELGQHNVYSVMTDGILAANKLQETGKDLGDWEYENPAHAIIVAPGLYAVYDSEGICKTTKQRGYPHGFNFGWVLREWGCRTRRNTEGPNSRTASGQVFVTIGAAIHSRDARNNFARFVERERKLKHVVMMGTSKRDGHKDEYWCAVDSEIWEASWSHMEMFTRRPSRHETNTSVMSRPYKYVEGIYKEEEILLNE